MLAQAAATSIKQDSNSGSNGSSSSSSSNKDNDAILESMKEAGWTELQHMSNL